MLCGKALRRHPAPFYLAAAALSIGTAYFANHRFPEIPAFVQQNVIALFTKGILAAAFWAVIMWTGALPNGSAPIKRLMPQRGQLSVFASILTLGHAVGLAIAMLPRWLKKDDAMNLTVCAVLMLIMLPLTVISVQKIRRKMKAKTWKTVQRWAYLFYALIPVHVIVLNLAKIRRGRTDILPDLTIYVTVFFGYAVCRLN
ncbi:MAG: ferric reductase-like transmembrane domain-containing protein, partial [Oscillospiraceae bacterium]|nr:ferric reductase-like transmembrane domain-containing protein [Oscillospiraceae bacterium]